MMSSFDIAVQAARTDSLKHVFVQMWPDARTSLVDDLLVFEKIDTKTRTAVGSLLLALISGMTVQYLIDPEGTPTAEDLTLAMKTIAKAFGERKG